MKTIFHHILALLKWLLPWHRGGSGDFRRHRRYLLQLVSLTKLAPIWEIRLRPAALWCGGFFLFILIGLLWLGAFVYTPMRNLLPAKMQADLRDDYIELSVRLDSTAARAAVSERYAMNMRQILLDTLSQSSVVLEQNLPERLPLDSLMEASAAERSFVARFEDSERFNLSVLSPIAAEGMTFYPPVLGTEKQERISEAGIPYALYSPGKLTPISAIYRGTVINAYYSTGRGVTVAIQHPNDFLSIYTGLDETFVTKGEKVKGSQRIGMAKSGPYPLTFELWHNGTPLPPSDYISE
ncbi:MAG: M23 family metallopeptidase [Bacteroidales bacterium]|nr:M23 family metallopeptidase [Bacteroidales bacterium]